MLKVRAEHSRCSAKIKIEDLKRKHYHLETALTVGQVIIQCICPMD